MHVTVSTCDVVDGVCLSCLRLPLMGHSTLSLRYVVVVFVVVVFVVIVFVVVVIVGVVFLKQDFHSTVQNSDLNNLTQKLTELFVLRGDDPSHNNTQPMDAGRLHFAMQATISWCCGRGLTLLRLPLMGHSTHSISSKHHLPTLPHTPCTCKANHFLTRISICHICQTSPYMLESWWHFCRCTVVKGLGTMQ